MKKKNKNEIQTPYFSTTEALLKIFIGLIHILSKTSSAVILSFGSTQSNLLNIYLALYEMLRGYSKFPDLILT